MLNIPQRVTGVTHPLVKSIYLKKSFGQKLDDENVLIIETLGLDPDDDYEIFDSYLIDILADLEDLKSQAERQLGPFDRVDIRLH